MNIEQFIEQNIDLVDSNNFTELYSHCVSGERGKLTEVLYECGIDPLEHMTEIPAMFASGSSLTNITIPDSVTSIGYESFRYCESLTSATIENGVTSIGIRAFSYCTNLKNISIPSSITSIGSSAFFKCTSLTTITIPDSVTSIGDWAFNGCGRLSIVYSGTKQEWINLVTGKKIFLYTTYVCNCVDGVVKKST